MDDQWYYRVFGQEFGPFPLDELNGQLQLGVLSPNDEVRSATSSAWVKAASVEGLGLDRGTSDRSPLASETGERPGSNDWYCRLRDEEIGPLGLDEIVALAEQRRLTGNDEVKLGLNGKWRRAGTLGRLAAVLPYQAIEVSVPAPASPDTQSRPSPPVVALPSQIVPTASAALKPASPALLPNAAVPTVDSGHPAAVSPRVLESQAKSTEQPPIQESVSGNGPGESSSSMNVAIRPGFPARPQVPAKQRESVDLLEIAKGPFGLCTGAVLLVVILYVASQYLPQGVASDKRRYLELKQVLDEIRAKRTQASGDFADVKAKAQKISEAVILALKDHATMQYPAKQHLLRAARDDLPTLLKEDLTVESSSETAFADRLSDAELALGLK